MNAELLTRVTALRDLRRAHAELATALAEKRAVFEKDHEALIKDAALARDAVAAAETAIKAIALRLTAYSADEIRKPAPGVEIKFFTVLEYDADQAFAWAKKTGMALIPESLDTAAFTKIATASPASFYFVTVTTEPRVQIGKDLDKALASTDAQAAQAAEATV